MVDYTQTEQTTKLKDLQNRVNNLDGGSDVDLPVSGLGVPTGPNDPRFINCVVGSPYYGPGPMTISDRIIPRSTDNTSILGYSGITTNRIVGYGREGLRLGGGGNCHHTDFYLEIFGEYNNVTGDWDHGDGCQGYTGGGAGNAAVNCSLTRGWINMLVGANNCGLFSADDARLDLVLTDIKITGGHNCPHGCVWFPNRPGDMGLHSIELHNVDVDYDMHSMFGIDVQGVGAWQPTIVAWDNVTENGVPIPRPY